ncbi:hypothetical protein K474DRAFT_1713200 [Panus rudis PR-1116 ss-1]|nr:hypothetical protein K474DRAFT_1713200 [Panus rudis PR-1116 ss-1]
MSSPETPSFGHTFGASILLIAVGFFLFGISVAQAYSYAINFPEDPRWIKAIVAVVIVLESAFSVLVLQSVYHETIVSFGSILEVNVVPWGAPVANVIQGVIVLICQSFLIHRVWIMSDHKVRVVVVLTILLIARVGKYFFFLEPCQITSSAVAHYSGTWLDYAGSHASKVSVSLSNSIGAASDGAIAASLVYFLRKNRSNINKRTESVLQRIIMYTINTGVLTMLVCVALVLTFFLSKGTLAFTGVLTVLGRLYANSVFGTLNMRRIWRRKINTDITSNSNHLVPPSNEIEFTSPSNFNATSERGA